MGSQVPSQGNPPAWLDPQGAGDHAVTSVSTILRAARRGDLRGYKLGKLWRFRASDIDAWIERISTPQAVRR